MHIPTIQRTGFNIQISFSRISCYSSAIFFLINGISLTTDRLLLSNLPSRRHILCGPGKFYLHKSTSTTGAQEANFLYLRLQNQPGQPYPPSHHNPALLMYHMWYTHYPDVLVCIWPGYRGGVFLFIPADCRWAGFDQLTYLTKLFDQWLIKRAQPMEKISLS